MKYNRDCEDLTIDIVYAVVGFFMVEPDRELRMVDRKVELALLQRNFARELFHT